MFWAPALAIVYDPVMVSPGIAAPPGAVNGLLIAGRLVPLTEK